MKPPCSCESLEHRGLRNRIFGNGESIHLTQNDILTINATIVTLVNMKTTIKNTDEKAAERRTRILTAARWCFLNFGFSKTSFEDIAKRANLSRTLLYRIFKDKEDIFTAVFADWLISRHPAAKEAATDTGNPFERLLVVCNLMVVEPWTDMVGAPMGGEFFDVCERIDPDVEAEHREVALKCVAAIIGNEELAEVFILSLDGLLTDQPSVETLKHRIRVLASRFVSPVQS